MIEEDRRVDFCESCGCRRLFVEIRTHFGDQFISDWRCVWCGVYSIQVRDDGDGSLPA